MVQGICVSFPAVARLGLKGERGMSMHWPIKEYEIRAEVGLGKHHKQREQQVYRPWARRESGQFRKKACMAGTKSEGKESMRKTQELGRLEHTEPFAFYPKVREHHGLLLSWEVILLDLGFATTNSLGSVW